MAQVENLNIKLLSYLQKWPSISLAWIFGSTASGRRRADSDIDLAVCADRKLTADELIQITSELSMDIGAEIDIVDLRCAHGAILDEILLRGILLFVKDPEHYSQLLKRFWYEKEDDNRFREKTMKARMARWSK